MEKSSTLYVGPAVPKDSIDIATADPGRDGEVRHLGSIGGDLASLDKALPMPWRVRLTDMFGVTWWLCRLSV